MRHNQTSIFSSEYDTSNKSRGTELPIVGKLWPNFSTFNSHLLIFRSRNWKTVPSSVPLQLAAFCLYIMKQNNSVPPADAA